MSQRIPDWVLERHLVGDALPAGFTEADLAADPSVPERLEKLKASDAEILERHPPRVVAAQVRARAEERGRRARRPMMVLLPVALAGVAAVVIALPRQPDVLTKGLEPHLEVFRKDEPARPLVSGGVGHPGDIIQLRVVSAGAKFGMVVAVDGEGAPVQVGALTVPDALELDATGQFERFILVTSDAPFEAADVLAAARRLGHDPAAKLELPAGLKQSSFVLLKKP